MVGVMSAERDEEGEKEQSGKNVRSRISGELTIEATTVWL